MIDGCTFYGKTTTRRTRDDGEAIPTIKLDNDDEDNNEEVSEIELEILQGQYTNAIDNNAGEGNNLLAKSEEELEAKVPTSLMSQVNEDCYDDNSKKKMSPVLALLMPKNLSAYSPVVANRSTGNYWESLVPGTRRRKLTQILHSPPMKDECSHKRTPPNIKDVNT